MTQLRMQLREAAERDARRGPLRRAVQTLRWDAGAPVVLAAAAVAVVAAFAFVVLPFLQRDETVPAGRDLRVVEHTPLVEQGGLIEPAFGAVWATDAGTGQIVRVDPRSRAIDARLDLGGEPVVVAGHGALWAVAQGRLLRIDPGSAKVTGTVALELPADTGVPIPGKGVMWVADALALRRIDTRRMVVDRKVELARGGFLVKGGAFDRDTIYLQRGDGRIASFDAATGARGHAIRPQRPAHLVEAVAGGLLLVSDEGVEVVDPRTGATRWMRGLGTSLVNGASAQGSTIWVQGSDATSGRDRLWQLDARDGRVVGTLTLPDFGVAGMAPVGETVWLVSPSGQLTVVAPS